MLESLRYNPRAPYQRATLAKQKQDLERQLRDEDVNFWKDTLLLRQALIDAGKEYAVTRTRSQLINDGHKQVENPMDTGYMQSART